MVPTADIERIKLLKSITSGLLKQRNHPSAYRRRFVLRKKVACATHRKGSKMRIVIVAVVVLATLVACCLLWEATRIKGVDPRVVVEVFGSQKWAKNVAKDDVGGHIDFTATGRGDYDKVVFIDRGFDGKLDEVRLYKAGRGDVVLFYPKGTIQPQNDKIRYSHDYWERCFQDVRGEVAASSATHTVWRKPATSPATSPN